MKKYIKAYSYGESQYTDMIKELLGWGYRGPLGVQEYKHDKCNFALYDSMYKIPADKANQYRALLKSKLGAKYITPWLTGGKIFFYANPDDIQRRYDEMQEQKRLAKEAKEAALMERLNTYDIDKYKPDAATIKKIMDYRARGSRVNVKAIKDIDKAIKYYYTACLIDWDELAGDIWDKLCGLGNGFSWSEQKANKDLLLAINKRVASDEQYADTRTDYEQKYDLPNTNGLFTFEEKNSWVPKSILMFFVNNNVPVHFGKRTSGSSWDRNGRQWSEVEHLTLFPDNNPIHYDLVVHTDEGGGATTYTGAHTAERVSAKQVIEDLKGVVERHNR